jgi:hypothetical protein
MVWWVRRVQEVRGWFHQPPSAVGDAQQADAAEVAHQARLLGDLIGAPFSIGYL